MQYKDGHYFNIDSKLLFSLTRLEHGILGYLNILWGLNRQKSPSEYGPEEILRYLREIRAEKTSRRSVLNSINSLKKKGLIEVVQKPNKVRVLNPSSSLKSDETSLKSDELRTRAYDYQDYIEQATELLELWEAGNKTKFRKDKRPDYRRSLSKLLARAPYNEVKKAIIDLRPAIDAHFIGKYKYFPRIINPEKLATTDYFERLQIQAAKISAGAEVDASRIGTPGKGSGTANFKPCPCRSMATPNGRQCYKCPGGRQ